jgi:hypothetical protein
MQHRIFFVEQSMAQRITNSSSRLGKLFEDCGQLTMLENRPEYLVLEFILHLLPPVASPGFVSSLPGGAHQFVALPLLTGKPLRIDDGVPLWAALGRRSYC